MTQRHEVSKCFGKNDADRLTQLRVATNLQFVKYTISANLSKSRGNKNKKSMLIVRKELAEGKRMNAIP